jgi:ABC-type nitrate/sulfonate/bicarbonate transport system substrate-binding protein
MPTTETRRRLLTMAALAGGASLPPRRPACAAEPARETNTVRLGKITVICFAPQYVCESLLRAEGFTDIRYIDTTIATQQEELGSDKLDFHSNLPLSHVIAIDDELPIKVVTAVHAGCYELFAHGEIRGIADLKGKTVGGDSRWLSLIAAWVGLDPKKDLTMVDVFGTDAVDLFAAGKLDAYIGLSARSAAIARAQGWPGYPEACRGPPVVTVFLLHDGGKPGLCRTIPGGDEARDPRRPESYRSVRERARSGCAAACRGWLCRTL